MTETIRLIVGVSGAQAPGLGLAVLRALQTVPGTESHLVVDRATLDARQGLTGEDFAKLADVTYSPGDLGAAISSGSFRTAGMVIAPCSMRTVAAIATGNTADLVTRAADVCLKERRRLVLVPDETPWNLISIRNMEIITLAWRHDPAARPGVLPPAEDNGGLAAAHRGKDPRPVRPGTRPVHPLGGRRPRCCPVR